MDLSFALWVHLFLITRFGTYVSYSAKSMIFGTLLASSYNVFDM